MLVLALSVASRVKFLYSCPSMDWARRAPALFIGLYLYAGISLAIQGSWLVFLTLLFANRRIHWAALLMGAAVLYTHFMVTLPPEEIEGIANVHLTEIKRSNQRFGRGWVLSGKIKTFEKDEEIVARNIPVRIYHKKRPTASDHRIAGHLKKSAYGYTLKTKEWQAEGNGGFALFRYRMKGGLRRYLRRHMKSTRCSSFLAGLVTGDFSEPHDFGRLGLQHLMAISGFHFSLIALVLAMLLRPIFSYKWAAGLLVLLLSSYFLFIGQAPSVQRAWIMALVVFFGWLLEKRSQALNTLGVALILVIMWEPFAVTSLGFQFSFLCTAAILLFYAPLERMLFANHELKEVIHMTTLNQYGAIILAFLRKTAALTLAVHLVVVPLTLFYFHRFPLLSLIYNLLFPFLVGGALLLLPFAIVVPPLFWLVEGLVAFVLDLSERIPITIDFTYHLHLPLIVLVAYFLLLFGLRLIRNPISVRVWISM